MLMSATGTRPTTLRFNQFKVSPAYVANNRPSASFPASPPTRVGSSCCTHDAIIDFHCVPLSVLMYRMPARLTVAGVAYLRGASEMGEMLEGE